jgi:hypothetical protein
MAALVSAPSLSLLFVFARLKLDEGRDGPARVLRPYEVRTVSCKRQLLVACVSDEVEDVDRDNRRAYKSSREGDRGWGRGLPVLSAQLIRRWV